KHNRLDLFQTGIDVQNDNAYAGGNDKSTDFLSAQNVSIKGAITDDKSRRTDIRFNVSHQIGELKTSYNINYVNFHRNTTPDGPWIGAYRYPANFNFDMVKDWENPMSPGNPLNYFTSQGSWLRNPYFLIGSIRDDLKQHNLNGKLELEYKLSPWAKVIHRTGLYNVNEQTRSTTRKFEAPGTRNTNGSVTDGTNTYTRVNSDLMLMLSKDFNKFTTWLLVGHNLRADDRKTTTIGASNLLYSDLFNQ